MEPVTTAIAAVTAASNAIAFIKARINDAQSVADISQQLGTLFDCQKKLNQERNKKAGVSDISLKHSIDFVLETRLIQEELNSIRTMIDLRFGPGTYMECVNHYNQKLREQKEAEKAARREAARRAKEIEETIKTTLLVTCIIAVAVALFIFLFATIAQSSAEEIVL